jgi:hypothetical protein
MLNMDKQKNSCLKTFSAVIVETDYLTAQQPLFCVIVKVVFLPLNLLQNPKLKFSTNALKKHVKSPCLCYLNATIQHGITRVSFITIAYFSNNKKRLLHSCTKNGEPTVYQKNVPQHQM